MELAAMNAVLGDIESPVNGGAFGVCHQMARPKTASHYEAEDQMATGVCQIMK
jgi:hypothetical protein